MLNREASVIYSEREQPRSCWCSSTTVWNNKEPHSTRWNNKQLPDLYWNKMKKSTTPTKTQQRVNEWNYADEINAAVSNSWNHLAVQKRRYNNSFSPFFMGAHFLVDSSWVGLMAFFSAWTFIFELVNFALASQCGELHLLRALARTLSLSLYIGNANAFLLRCKFLSRKKEKNHGERERERKSHTRFAMRNQRDWLSYSHWRKIIQSHVADVFEKYILSGKNAGKSFDQSQRQERIYSRFSSWTSASAVCSPARWHKQIFCISKCCLKFALILIHSLTQTYKPIGFEWKGNSWIHQLLLTELQHVLGLIFAKSTANAQKWRKTTTTKKSKTQRINMIIINWFLVFHSVCGCASCPTLLRCLDALHAVLVPCRCFRRRHRSLVVFVPFCVYECARAFGKTKNRHLLLPAYILHSSFGCFSFFVSASCLWNQNNKIPKQIPSTITVAILQHLAIQQTQNLVISGRIEITFAKLLSIQLSIWFLCQTFLLLNCSILQFISVQLIFALNAITQWWYAWASFALIYGIQRFMEKKILFVCVQATNSVP